MQRTLRKAQWFVGVAWALSWFELYLEIYRHRHASPPRWLRLPSPPLAVEAGAHAGAWLRLVLACAALAPWAFVALGVWRRVRRTTDPAPLEPAFPLARVAGGIGLGLCVVGVLNQALRRPPMVVDLTLRTGNGGFIMIGAALAAGALAAGRVHTRRASA